MVHDSQFTVHDSQFTVHDSQYTVHDSRFILTLSSPPLLSTSLSSPPPLPSLPHALRLSLCPLSPSYISVAPRSPCPPSLPCACVPLSLSLRLYLAPSLSLSLFPSLPSSLTLSLSSIRKP